MVEHRKPDEGDEHDDARRPDDREGRASGDDGPGGRPDEDAWPPVAKPPTPLTQQLGRVVVLVLLALIAIFAVANSQRVDFSWLFGSSTVRDDPSGQGTTGGVPLILLLLASLAIGVIVGALVDWQIRRGRRSRRDREGR